MGLVLFGGKLHHEKLYKRTYLLKTYLLVGTFRNVTFFATHPVQTCLHLFQTNVRLRVVLFRDSVQAEPAGPREGGAHEGQAGARVSPLRKIQDVEEVQPPATHQASLPFWTWANLGYIYVYEVYREFHLLANLGWVDFALGCSTILLGQ